jgi:TolB-like protein/DNA-binding winged helix-turn-helix (wHTH) protein
MSQIDPQRLSFDDLVIDFAGRRLWRGGREQMLEPKAFAVLALLAGSPGRVFTRDEILDVVWGHRHVTQSVLNRIMSLLRQALGEDAQHPRRLHTVYGVGYRFDLPTGDQQEQGPQGDASVAVAGDSAVENKVVANSRRRPRLAAVAIAVVLVSSGSAWLLRKQHDAPPPAPTSAAAAPSTNPRPSLAVLPFADLSQAQDQSYLADGLAEEILNQLAQSPALRVVGRTSSFSFKGKPQDLKAIGDQLGVAYLLQGSVRKEGDALRVTAQLLRADDGSHVWSRVYARQLRDVFAVQDDISRDVAQALSVTLDVAKFNREQGGTTQVDAYQRYLRWREIGMQEQFDFNHDRERVQLAREMVALDPRCVLCQDALAISLNALAQELQGAQGEPLRAEAEAVRQRIARIAPDSWVAKRDHSNRLWREGRRAEAIALAKQIMDAGPLNKERVWDYVYMIYAMGQLEDTIALVEQVRAVEPMALFLSRDLQYDYTAARRYRDAEAEYRRGQALPGSQREPDYVALMRQLAGQRAGGVSELRALHARLLQPSSDLDTAFFRDLGAVLDDRAAMLGLVRRALADPAYAGGANRGYVITSVADALGDTDLAIAALQKELQAQPGFAQGTMPQYAYVGLWNAPYSGLRARPEFKQLLIQAGVVDYWRQSGRWGAGCKPGGAQDFSCR